MSIFKVLSCVKIVNQKNVLGLISFLFFSYSLEIFFFKKLSFELKFITALLQPSLVLKSGGTKILAQNSIENCEDCDRISEVCVASMWRTRIVDNRW